MYGGKNTGVDGVETNREHIVLFKGNNGSIRSPFRI